MVLFVAYRLVAVVAAAAAGVVVVVLYDVFVYVSPVCVMPRGKMVL